MRPHQNLYFWLPSGTVLLLMLAGLSFRYADTAVAESYALVPDGFWAEGGTSGVRPISDRFGPGAYGFSVPSVRGGSTQVDWTLEDLPEGGYFLGLPVEHHGFFTFSESIRNVSLLLNDRLLPWTSHSEPQRAEASGRGRYQAELRPEGPLRLRPGDRLRLVSRGPLVIGALRVSLRQPEDSGHGIDPRPHLEPDPALWIAAEWMESREEDGRIVQPVRLLNLGSHPLSVTLSARAADHLEPVLLELHDAETLPPRDPVQRTLVFPPGDSGLSRLFLSVTAGDPLPRPAGIHLARYYGGGRRVFPRPRIRLPDTWDFCRLPPDAVEPGNRPPPDATWTPIPVPSLQRNDESHCAWYRVRFRLPDDFRGERYVARFHQLISESWIYVNGRFVHHEFNGSDGFEADLTAGLLEDEENEVLIAVRDWIAYSPLNRERVQRGEKPVFKEGMTAPAGYILSGNWGPCMGIGIPPWLEARAAVAVTGTRIATHVRSRRIDVAYRIENQSGQDQSVTLHTRVLDRGAGVLELPERSVHVPAGDVRDITVSSPWPDPRLWQPGDPYLYVLETRMTPEHGDADRRLERFGFRDMHIEGARFLVNDVPMKLRSNWATVPSGVLAPGDATDPAERRARIARRQLRALHEQGVQITRTHNDNGVHEVCDVADETGLMIKVENGNLAQQRFTPDPAFWQAAMEGARQMVHAYHNHPAVFMWSAGNENMWSWIHQSAEVRQTGTAWQRRLETAMRDADLAGRPIEWDADGDLMGSAEFHSLHYPRELNTHPDLPDAAWWGWPVPRPGTVAPYVMGPVTLGEKPLSVGESMWPATSGRPFGATLFLGDDGYRGGHPQFQIWEQAGRFFLNGFRDVEFALIDTYLSMHLMPELKIVDKQESRVFFGGRSITRHLNVHNDTRETRQFTLHWSLTPEGETTPWLDESRSLTLDPAALQRLELEIPVPSVPVPVQADWSLRLLEGETEVARSGQTWSLHPPPRLKAPTGLRLGVFDPEGALRALLAGFELPFETMAEGSGLDPRLNAILIGRGGLEAAERAMGFDLAAFVRRGGKVLVLESERIPSMLPLHAAPSTGRRGTLAFRRAADHPALHDIEDSDLRWWADDHTVHAVPFRQPEQGNWLPLIDSGTMEGLMETPLLEAYYGAGAVLVCQLALTEKARVAPQALRILQNLLDYLADPRCFRTPRPVALVDGAGEDLRTLLSDLRVAFEILDPEREAIPLDRHALVMVDARHSLHPGRVPALRAFAESGGRVLLHRAGPEQHGVLDALLGMAPRFLEVAAEPPDVQNRVMVRHPSGLLSGISSHSFFWGSRAYVDALRRTGHWSADVGDRAPDEWIADHTVLPPHDRPERARTLTNPSVLLEVPAGRGGFVLSQLRIDEPHPDVRSTVRRLTSLLLTNLEGSFRIEADPHALRAARLSAYAFEPVDLSPWTNRGRSDDPDAGIVGWTNQGDNDARELPVGRHVLAGIPFLLAAPKPAIVLYSTQLPGNEVLPRDVAIDINGKADVLFFLHTSAYTRPEGIQWRYRVRYADGTEALIPVRSGQETIDWWSNPDRFPALPAHGTVSGWRGSNPRRNDVGLVCFEWRNPHPERTIQSVVFEVAEESEFRVVPVLTGLTLGRTEVTHGIVEEVIGVEGLRVRIGDRIETIRYIGIEPLDPAHPGYDAAAARHREWVRGQAVVLKSDTVLHDPEGRRLAYVALERDGDDFAALLNTRLISEGLAPGGAFHGNTRYRMALDNLAFIARLNRIGIWAAND